MINLGDKLRLSDNDFDVWLEEIGFLHGKNAGNNTNIYLRTQIFS